MDEIILFNILVFKIHWNFHPEYNNSLPIRFLDNFSSGNSCILFFNNFDKLFTLYFFVVLYFLKLLSGSLIPPSKPFIIFVSSLINRGLPG